MSSQTGISLSASSDGVGVFCFKVLERVLLLNDSMKTDEVLILLLNDLNYTR